MLSRLSSATQHPFGKVSCGLIPRRLSSVVSSDASQNGHVINNIVRDIINKVSISISIVCLSTSVVST